MEVKLFDKEKIHLANSRFDTVSKEIRKLVLEATQDDVVRQFFKDEINA